MEFEEFLRNVLYEPFGEVEIKNSEEVEIMCSRKFTEQFSPNLWASWVVYPAKLSKGSPHIKDNCILFNYDKSQTILEIYSPNLKNNRLTIFLEHLNNEEFYNIYEKIIHRIIYKLDTYKRIQHYFILGKTVDEFINQNMRKTICYLLQDIGFPIKKYTSGIADSFFKDKFYIEFTIKKKLNKKEKVATHVIKLSDSYLEIEKFTPAQIYNHKYNIPIPEEIKDYDFYCLYFKTAFKELGLL